MVAYLTISYWERLFEYEGVVRAWRGELDVFDDSHWLFVTTSPFRDEATGEYAQMTRSGIEASSIYGWLQANGWRRVAITTVGE